MGTKSIAKDIEVLHKDVIERAKSTGCRLCGSFNKLCFHHRNPDTKVFEITAYFVRGMNKGLVEELDKCVVLCVTCHGRVHGSNSPPAWIIDKDLYYDLQEEAGPDRHLSARDRSLKIQRSRHGRRV